MFDLATPQEYFDLVLDLYVGAIASGFLLSFALIFREAFNRD